ncbi:MAG: hypothetical protein NC231_12875 [Bacillus sp. (in: Bacteria)]|nr:hypothetical protein [Bacillus sp. (in: firmicutes)]MCM1426682.1 hypothetical protein [Eubacterium sp.]
MRMTNKIMRNNSLYNINQNKILEDKLSNQMTNQSKITRPSDDPVVAIRALRLRTNVTTVTQYYDKNAPDADSWLSITGDALDTVGSVLKNLYEQVTEASQKSYTAEDLEILVTQMKSLTNEFYASGNVDYAGRYVFSGFRTDTPITFREEDIKEFTKDPENLKTYVIQESMGYHDILSVSYTDWSKITTNTTTGAAEGTELDVTNTKLYRYRLSYDNLNLKTTDAGGNAITYPVNNTATPNPIDDVFQITDKDGNPMTVTAYADAESAYKALADGSETGLAYVAESGEIVFNEDYYSKLKENSGISVKYAKSNWQTGDINPVHYFRCVATDAQHADAAMTLSDKQAVLQQAQNTLAIAKQENEPKIEQAQKDLEKAKRDLRLATNAGAIAAAQAQVDNLRTQIATWQGAIDTAQADVDAAQADVDAIMRNAIEYNADGRDQDIYYNVGFNQTIQVNTHADEVFTHGAQRDIDDFTIYLKQLQDAEAKIANIEDKMKEYAEDSTQYADLKKQLEAMNKAYTYIRDNVQTKFENQITRYQKYIDDANVAVTNNGTRGSRLDLISDRLMNQKATFKDLQSNNEDVDVTEVAVQLKSSELTYEAALMATSKIMQTNLMNYI